MKNIISYITIAFLSVMCILYMYWLNNDYLDTTYSKVAVFIACYGGLIANILYVIRNKK